MQSHINLEPILLIYVHESYSHHGKIDHFLYDLSAEGFSSMLKRMS